MPEPIVPPDPTRPRPGRAGGPARPPPPSRAGPAGTAAGQLFQREVQHLQALRAVHSQQEPSHVHL